MPYETPTGVPLEVDDDEGRLKPDLDEQLPLQVFSSDDGCFIYDNHGAEVGYTYTQDFSRHELGVEDSRIAYHNLAYRHHLK